MDLPAGMSPWTQRTGATKLKETPVSQSAPCSSPYGLRQHHPARAELGKREQSATTTLRHPLPVRPIKKAETPSKNRLLFYNDDLLSLVCPVDERLDI